MMVTFTPLSMAFEGRQPAGSGIHKAAQEGLPGLALVRTAGSRHPAGGSASRVLLFHDRTLDFIRGQVEEPAPVSLAAGNAAVEENVVLPAAEEFSVVIPPEIGFFLSIQLFRLPFRGKKKKDIRRGIVVAGEVVPDKTCNGVAIGAHHRVNAGIGMTLGKTFQPSMNFVVARGLVDPLHGKAQ